MPPATDLDKLKTRIAGLRAKTIENGCTEAEALAAAAKVAELLDRHDLALSDVELRDEACDELAFEPSRKKRIPLDECVGAIADFCDCRVWREKGATGHRFVFFGLAADIAVAHYLTDLVDTAVRSELGRYKTSPAYQAFRHNERHLANASFTLGMLVSIAEKLGAMKVARDQANRSSGRDLVMVKSAIVDAELARRGLDLKAVESGRRYIAPDAFDAGTAAGAALRINRAIDRSR
jgi:hypothetical protein